MWIINDIAPSCESIPRPMHLLARRRCIWLWPMGCLVFGCPVLVLLAEVSFFILPTYYHEGSCFWARIRLWTARDGFAFAAPWNHIPPLGVKQCFCFDLYLVRVNFRFWHFMTGQDFCQKCLLQVEWDNNQEKNYELPVGWGWTVWRQGSKALAFSKPQPTLPMRPTSTEILHVGTDFATRNPERRGCRQPSCLEDNGQLPSHETTRKVVVVVVVVVAVAASRREVPQCHKHFH